VAAAIAAPFLAWQVTVLVGWSAAATAFLVWVGWVVLPMDSNATAAHATREDDSRFAADLTLLAASVSSLVAVGLTLVKASQQAGTTKAVFTGTAVLAVVLAWAVVHTVFTLGYGRLFYGDGRGIAFGGNDEPSYRDFAYVAFTIGMTYQVSDTDITSAAVRAVILRHALLSYLFGTAIIAMLINVVAGLLR